MRKHLHHQATALLGEDQDVGNKGWGNHRPSCKSPILLSDSWWPWP